MYQAKTSERKRNFVKELTELMDDSQTTAIVTFAGIPADTMLDLRAEIREQVSVKVGKIKLINLVFNEVSSKVSGITDLIPYMQGQVGVAKSSLDPIALNNLFKTKQQPAYAKPGDIAPADIVIEKGDTDFPPGPIISELQGVGLPAKIDKGKVVIQKRHVAVKAGELIDADMAGVLQKLEIKPFTTGIVILAALEDGVVFTPDLLDFDPAEYIENLGVAIGRANALATELVYLTPSTAPLLVGRAHSHAMAVAMEAGIVNSTTVKPMLGRAYAQMLALASSVSADALSDALRSRLAGAAAAAPAAAAPASADEPEDEPEDDDDDDDDGEEMAGLGALFG